MARIELSTNAFPGTTTTVTVAPLVMTAGGQSFRCNGGNWFLVISNTDIAGHTLTVVDQRNAAMTQDGTVTLPASSTVIHAGNPSAVSRTGQLIHIDPELAEHANIEVQYFTFVPSKA